MFLVQSHLGQEEGRTTMVAAPALKTIGALCLQNTYDTSSRKECGKDATEKPVQDAGDDAISSHHKSMFLVQSHLGQEEGRTTIMASPTLKMIGASGLQNTSNTSSRTVCKKYGADKLVQDEGDYAIASHQESMF